MLKLRYCLILLALLIFLVACGFPQEKSPSSKTIKIMGVVTGEGEEQIQKAFAPFTEKTGIKVIYEGTNEFATLLPVRVDSGNPPDVAMFPQPGLMADFAREGKLIPVDSFMDKEQLSKDYAKDWIDLGSVDGKIYGIWYRAFVKSLVWYNPAAFAAKGYKIPTTWSDAIALSDKIVADGGVPWCLGMENGNATGWVGTDWVEDIILHKFGPEVYDGWVSHKIPFTNPQVKAGFEEFGKIVRNPKYVVGGTTGVISIPFGDSPKGLFEQPPSCYMHRQATFITAFLPKKLVIGKDVDVFPFPAINQKFGGSVLVSGEVMAMFKDTPEVRALMEYLATPKPHEIWASFGGYLSPHKQVRLTAYPDEVMKRQAEILNKANVLRFDASDMMPGAVGTGTFWTGIVDYVGGKDVDSVLKNIDESWPNLSAKPAPTQPIIQQEIANIDMNQIFSAILAVIVGCGGVIDLLYGMSLFIELLPYKLRSQILPWLYLSPALLLLTAYLILPTVNTIYISFFDRRSQNFIGLDNYIFALTSETMAVAFRNNLLWLVLVTGLSVSLGLILAVLMDKVRYEAIAKSLIFLPMAISFVGASVIWRFVYAFRPSGAKQIGLLNGIITSLGFPPIGWLVEESLNNFALIAIMIWLQTGFCLVLLSAAVKGIPKDIIEAARIDGANEWQIFWRITIPTIRPTIAVVATTVVIMVLKVFDIVFVMTAGNQGTEVIASRMIKEMFNYRDYGRGSAIAVILLLAIVPVTIGNIRRFQRQSGE